MRRAFVDANVFVYATGAEHRWRDPCRRLIRMIGERAFAAETSVEVIQEVIHLRRRRGDARATDRGREIIALGMAVHGFEQSDLERAMELLDAHPGLQTRDAVHAACAIERGIEWIVSTDADFDAVPGLSRIDPADRRGVAHLEEA